MACNDMTTAPRVLLGITGTLGAGKGTVVDYLVKNHGFKHFSVRSYLTQIIEQRGLAVNRDAMVSVANDLRKQHSPSYIAEQLLELADKCEGSAIIESIRTLGEVDALEKSGKGSFFLLAVDGDPSVRYTRITGRNSATDDVSFDKFVGDEKRELENDDPNKQNLRGCIQRSSFTIMNDKNLNDLHDRMESVLAEMRSKSLASSQAGGQKRGCETEQSFKNSMKSAKSGA